MRKKSFKMKKGRLAIPVLLLAVLWLLAELFFPQGSGRVDWIAYDGGAVNVGTPGVLEVHIIDIGQGDAILLKMNGEADTRMILIDGGPEASADRLGAYLKVEKAAFFDWIIATHPHEDHIGGLPETIRTHSVQKVLMPEKTADTRTFEALLDAIREKNLKITPAGAGQQIAFGAATLSVLSPERGKETENPNNASVVVLLEYAGRRVLLTGDAEAEVEKQVLERFSEEPVRLTDGVDILKVGHHGSKTSSSEPFVSALLPRYAVISCAENNRYGHPAPEVLSRFEARRTQVLRTDLGGSVLFTIAEDGDLRVFTERAA